MHNNKFLFRSLLICLVLAAVACAPTKGAGLGGAIPGSGNLKSERRETTPFEAITVEYPADVTVQQGGEDTLEIQAEDNLLPQISTQVSSGRLTIGTTETDWKTRVNPSRPVKIAITARNLKEIAFSAPVGTLEMTGWRADALTLVLDGGAQVKLNGIQVALLDSVLSGAGDILVTGTADEIKLIHSGVGNFKPPASKASEPRSRSAAWGMRLCVWMQSSPRRSQALARCSITEALACSRLSPVRGLSSPPGRAMKELDLLLGRRLK